MKLLFTSLSLLFLGIATAHASVVQCQEKTVADGKSECTVKFMAARPLAVLACVGGAGDFVLYTEGDAELILATEAPVISGEIKGASWLEVAERVLEQTNKAIKTAKMPARVQADTVEYQEAAPAQDAAPAPDGPKRKLFRVTGVLRKPAPPKERITFFNPKKDQ